MSTSRTGLVQPTPAESQRLKEIVIDRPEEEIYAEDAVVQLVSQVCLDPFEEVKSKRENKKPSHHMSVDCCTDYAPSSILQSKHEWPSIEKMSAAASSRVVCVIETIPEEQTMNILSRLTAIELVHCKAVCKSWNSLISSPDFVSQHLKRTKSDPSSHHLLVCNSNYSMLSDNNIPGPFNSVSCFSSQYVVIVGSVNGLICMAGESLHSTKTADDIWILNPATGLSRKLPLPSKPRLTYQTEEVLFAFWFDGVVYKVARLVSVYDGPAVLEVWVSNSPDTWTEVTTLDFQITPGFRFVHDCDVLVEGFGAYWIVTDYDEDIFVLWLDLNALTLKSIPLSDKQKYIARARSGVLIGILNKVLFGAKLHGKFVVIQNGFNDDGKFYIWTMSMDSGEFGGWKLIHSIILNFPFERVWCMNERLVLGNDFNVLNLHDMDTGAENYLGEDYELEDMFMNSAHDFWGSLVSIEGFERNDLKDLNIGFSWPSDYPHGWGRICKKMM